MKLLTQILSGVPEFPRLLAALDSGGCPAAVSGLSAVGGMQVYVARGLSTNGAVPLMPFRLFNPPEICVLTLTSTLPENMLEAG